MSNNNSGPNHLPQQTDTTLYLHLELIYECIHNQSDFVYFPSSGKP